jgi:hypothetical protein
MISVWKDIVGHYVNNVIFLMKEARADIHYLNLLSAGSVNCKYLHIYV